MKEEKEANKEEKERKEYAEELIKAGNYHEGDMIFYRIKHPDFTSALKGRKITLKALE